MKRCQPGHKQARRDSGASGRLLNGGNAPSNQFNGRAGRDVSSLIACAANRQAARRACRLRAWRASMRLFEKPVSTSMRACARLTKARVPAGMLLLCMGFPSTAGRWVAGHVRRRA